MAEIDDICSDWDKTVVLMAEQRDIGTPSSSWISHINYLYKARIIGDFVYAISLGYVEIVYGTPDMSPDKLGFMAKERCVDYYMENDHD